MFGALPIHEGVDLASRLFLYWH